MLTKMGGAFGNFLLLAKTPSYLATVFGMSIEQNGLVNAGINLTSVVSSLSASPLSNWLIRATGWKTIWVRKLVQCSCMLGAAFFIVTITWMDCDQAVIMPLLFLATFTYYFFPGGEWSTVSDYAPNFSGTVSGFGSVLAFAMGFVAPYISGLVLNERASRHEWNQIFYIYGGMMAFSSTVYLLFATDEQQEWDKIDQIVEAKMRRAEFEATKQIL